VAGNDPPGPTRISRRSCSTLATSSGSTSAALPVMLTSAPAQGLTLVHFLAQLKRMLWHRGASRMFLGGISEVSGGIKEYQGVFRVYFVSETAQVELRSGRV